MKTPIRFTLAILLLSSVAVSSPAHAQTVITLYDDYAGHPQDVATDGSGNVFFVDNLSVNLIFAPTYKPFYNLYNQFTSGGIALFGIAVDANDNVFFTDFKNNVVQELSENHGIPTAVTLGSGFNQPSGIAVDAHGNVFVADTGNNSVKEILASNSATVTLSSSFIGPMGIAVDGNGNIFVSNGGDNSVKEIVAVGGSIPASPTINTLASGFNAPSAVAVDANGDVFVANCGSTGSGRYAVDEIVAVGGSIPASPTINTLGNGFICPTGVAVDRKGNVFVADSIHNAVKEIVANDEIFANGFE